MPSPQQETKMPSPAPVIPEDNNAEAAYARVAALIAGVPDGALELLNVDLDRVGKTAYALAQKCVSDDIWPHLARLPKEQFDAPAAVVELADLALAASWLATRGLTVRAADTTVQLPQALVQRALGLKKDMFDTCDYCLDDEASSAELASIRAGTGYDDLKHDLRRLAVLYRNQKTELSGKRYDPAHAAEALAVADEINLRQRGTTAVDQVTLERRAWTLLRAAGERAFEAAHFVTYHAPAVRSSIKSIHTWRNRPTPTAKAASTPELPTPADGDTES